MEQFGIVSHHAGPGIDNGKNSPFSATKNFNSRAHPSNPNSFSQWYASLRRKSARRAAPSGPNRRALAEEAGTKTAAGRLRLHF
jgi:hypothetical protein